MLSKNIKKAGGFKNIKYRKYGSLMKTTYKSKKAPALTVQTIKSIAAKEVHKNIEDKTSTLVNNNCNLTSYNGNTTMNVTTCIPTVNMVQGNGGQSGRIGNTVRTRGLYFNFVLYPNKYDALTNPIPKPQEVLIFLGKVKGQTDRTPNNPTDFTRLFQLGNSSTSPYADLRDLTSSVNKDYFTVYKIMRFKVGNASYNGGTTGTSLINYYFANNDYKYNVVKRMNITKYCPKVLKFNDTTLSPTNDNLYMWAECVNSDGSAPGLTDLHAVTMSYSFTYFYEDA